MNRLRKSITAVCRICSLDDAAKLHAEVSTRTCPCSKKPMNSNSEPFRRVRAL